MMPPLPSPLTRYLIGSPICTTQCYKISLLSKATVSWPFWVTELCEWTLVTLQVIRSKPIRVLWKNNTENIFLCTGSVAYFLLKKLPYYWSQMYNVEELSPTQILKTYPGTTLYSRVTGLILLFSYSYVSSLLLLLCQESSPQPHHKPNFFPSLPFHPYPHRFLPVMLESLYWKYSGKWVSFSTFLFCLYSVFKLLLGRTYQIFVQT